MTLCLIIQKVLKLEEKNINTVVFMRTHNCTVSPNLTWAEYQYSTEERERRIYGKMKIQPHCGFVHASRFDCEGAALHIEKSDAIDNDTKRCLLTKTVEM